ncbi:hypothetical protein CSIM01_00583 [Colletotrichum simmondsii]|uniref:Uncharacterized protein n=1 Tax=Colletotrichum simmondsii TaxID=703756 RepID=A0A135SIY8_9PEZI|nr:hypothetical protein CSIM01_00583 [Colletotrichum simmondsii]
MDPVTAVALAGNLLQFTQFVVGLFNDARKLHTSAAGTSSNNNHIQDVCGMLINFNGQFQQPQSAPSINPTRATSSHGKQLPEFANSCKQDCEVLLGKMNKLKVIGAKGPKHWRSFRAALSEVWQSSEIEEYRTRIADRQRAMTLLLCLASNIKTSEDHVEDLGRGIWALHSDSRLDFMIEEITKLGNYIRQQNSKTPTSVDIDTMCSGVSKMSLETQIFEKEAQVLAKLNFMDRTSRYERIPEAHFTTFKWSLRKTEQTGVMYSKLRHWLRGKDTLFWVTGKPGSGKSTFMKHIADNKDMKECLKAWAGTRELLVISHYFTIYGTSIQRSLEGLLRSLLFGVLVRKPALIPKIIPDGWGKASAAPRQSEFETFLRLLWVRLDELSCKIIFFIDGLDEFEGDHIDLCETLKELSRIPSIKMCVSSRPWNVFEDALGERSDSKLYMHELTYNDILDYTTNRLQAHPRWSVLLEEFSFVSSMSLIEEVAFKSKGVFLWVTLVVRLLRESLTNDDSLSDLQRRLETFPEDLQEFFRHIIKSVDPFYNEKMAGTLSLALQAQGPLRIEIFSLHDFEYGNENYAFKDIAHTKLMPTDPEILEKIYRSVSRRINGRCKGLLERNGDRMEFLHRTVYDFLRTGEMDDFLREHTNNSHCFSLSLSKAFVAWIKTSTFASETSSPSKNATSEVAGFIPRLKQGLSYARLATMQGESSEALTAALLDNLENSLPRMLSRGQVKLTDPSFATTIFRHCVLEAGILGYIRRKLSVSHEYLMGTYASRVQSPLYPILDPCHTLAKTDQCWILKKLLESGYDPNSHIMGLKAKYHFQSPWEFLFCRRREKVNPTVEPDTQWWQKDDDLLALAENRILLTLLEHGANPVATAIEFDENERLEMPIWLRFFITIRRVHLLNQPTVYEETLFAMLNDLETLENITVARESHSETLGGILGQEKVNFWDVCQSWAKFILPTTTGSCGDEFLTRVFARVLAKIPAENESFRKAEAWCKTELIFANQRSAALWKSKKIQGTQEGLGREEDKSSEMIKAYVIAAISKMETFKQLMVFEDLEL